MKTKTIKFPTIKDIDFEIIATYEDIPVRGNAMASGDDAVDKKAEDRIIRQIEAGNVWAWASVKVRGEYKGLTASDYLGGCSYKNEAGFKRGGYYEDMKQTVFSEIIKQLEAL